MVQANVKMNQGRHAEAVSIYERLLRENGSYGVRYDEWLLDWQLGLALEGAGQASEALNHFEKACRSQHVDSCTKAEELRARL